MFNLNAILNIVGANTSSVKAAVSDINSEMDRGTRKARSFGDAVALKGANLGVFAVASTAVIKLTESISMATRDALRFEVEMAKIAQTVGISTTEARKHGEEIRKLSVLYGLSAPKIAETVRVLAQAGYTLRQAKEAADNLSQTTLLSSFESITDTTDGLIAVNKQFIDTIGKSAQVLSLFNVVSKKYAVESADLVEVVRKAGGTFSATGGKLEELLAVFTTVRDTTRESAETIAVGLRTIFTRLQRPKTIEYLQQFGIELVNLEGQFVGNFEAIQRIQRGLDAFGVRPGSIKFAEVVEEIGGVLQQSRVIPLLTQGAKLQQVYADAQSASSETAMDLAKAQDTLSFKIAQTQQNFAKLIGDIASSKGFDTLVRGVLSMTNAMIHFAAAIKDVLPLISALLAFNLAKSVGKLALGGPKAFLGKGFATGGFVPGSGSGDTVPAMLTPGEFVIRKSAAQAMGAEALHGINKYAKGGPVKGNVRDVSKSGQILSGLYDIGSPDDSYSGKLSVELLSVGGKEVTWDDVQAKGEGFANQAVDIYKKTQGEERDKIKAANKYLKRANVLGDFALEYREKTEGRNMFARGTTTGLINNLKGAYAEKLFKQENPRAKKLKAFQGADFKTNGGFVEIKSTIDEVGEKLIIAKALKATGVEAKRKNRSFLNEKPDEVDLGNVRHVRTKKYASGGSVGTDTVPSLLTPGEFVVNKKSAQAFGYGNLQKVNKYASGGVVGVRRFASGGPVGGEMLPGLSGLGDLAIVVNQLIPALGNATASFAAISVQGALLRGAFSAIAGTGKGVSDFYTNYKAEAERLSQVRADEYAAYKDANNKYVTATTDLRAARTELSLAETILPTSGTAVKGSIAADFQERDIEAASKRAKASVAGVASQNFSQPEVDEANDRLTTSINKLIARYGPHSDQVEKAKDIQKSLNGTLSPYNNNIKAAADAVEKYTELVNAGAVEQRELVTSLRDQARAARKTMRENGKSFSSRLGSAASGTSKFLSTDNKATQALATGAAAGMAALAASASSAADAAKRLSEEAIASGDAQGAYTNSLKATAQEQKASAIEQGASIGGAIGSLFGPMGTALGTAVGGLLGFTGAITYITDLLGLTDSEGEAKAKALEQRRSAALVKADKISSTAVSKSAEVRRFDPNRANSILAKGVKDLKDYNASEGSIANKDIQEQSKALFSASSSAIEELSQKAINTGKSFDQLAKENTVLFDTWKTSGDMIEGNSELMRGMISQHNAVATLAQKERATRLAAINLQLQQLSIQKQINTSLAHMDSVIKTQNEALMGFGAALGEDYSPPDIGVDLTDLSNRNTSNPDYARGLSSVSSLGGPFAQEAAILGRAIPAVSGLADRLVNQNSDEQITQSLGGLPPKMIEEIMKRITDARAEAKSSGTDINPADIQQEIIDKVIKPITENVENGRKAINTQLQNQLSILKKQSELQKKQLEYRLAGLDAEREIADTIDKVRGTEADPRAERAARLNRAGTILQGTSLQGANLAGDKSDVDKIGKALAAAELSKQRVVGKLQTVQDPNVRVKLDEEMVGLTKETERLNEAMSSLGDVSKENAAIEAKIAKNQEKRAVVREAASNLAFGSGQDRKDFFRTLNQARGVAAFGTADVLRDKDKGGVFSFLKQMKDIPAFNGKTGQEVIDATTRNYLLRGGVAQEKVKEIMDKMIPSEEQALKLMTDNMTVDVARNALLVKILAALGGDIGFMKDPGQIAQVAAGMSTGGSTNTIFKPRGTDTIPAMLTPGEYVVSAKNAKKNMGTLAAINSGKTKYLDKGTENKSPPIRNVAPSVAAYYKKKEDEAMLAANTEEYGQPFNNAQREEERRKFAAFQGKPPSDAQPQKASTTQPASQPKKSQGTSIILPAYEGLDNSAPTAMDQYESRLSPENKKKLDEERTKKALDKLNKAKQSATDYQNDLSLKAAATVQIANQEKEVSDSQNRSIASKAALDGGASNVFNDAMMNGQRDSKRLEYQKKYKDSGVTSLYDTPEAKANSDLNKTKPKSPSPGRKPYIPSSKFSRGLDAKYAAQGSASAQVAEAAPVAPVVKAKKPKPAPIATTSPAVPEVTPEFASEYASHAPPAKKGPVSTPAVPTPAVPTPVVPAAMPTETAAQPAQVAAIEQEAQSNGRNQGRRRPSDFGERRRRSDFGQRRRLVDGKTYKERMTESRQKLDATAASITSGPQIPAAQQNGGQNNPVAMGGTVRQSQGQSQGQGQAPDFSSLMAAMKTFNTEFSSSVQILNEMPKIFKIDLSSQGINVNLNSAEFLAKVPETMRAILLETITSKMGEITATVKQNLANGTA